MSSERGFTLTEVMVAMALMILLLGAVLTTFNGFERSQRAATQRTEAQDAARTGIDRLARDMRNAVSAGSPIADSVERADPDDLMFQTVGTQAPTVNNPTAKIRVRYCLDSSTPSNGKLYKQVQVFSAAPTAKPTATACPGPAGAPPSGWTTTTLVTKGITNRYNGAARPLFAYRFTPDESTALSELVAVTPTVYIDPTPGAQAPAEVVLRTAIELRNANQPPIAMFTVTVQARKLVLNASGSIDPERQALRYEWYIDGATTNPLTGVRVEAGPLSVGTHSVRLVVKDQANASNETTRSAVVS